MPERGIRSIAGPLFFAVFAVLFLGGSYAMWPPDFFSASSSEMTTGVLLRVIASPVLAIVGPEFLGALVIAVVTDN